MPLFGPPDVDKLRVKRDVQGLIKALGFPKDSYIRQNAAEALGAIGDPRAVKPLIVALNDIDSGVRKTAVYALGNIGDSRAAEPLIAALKDKTWGHWAVEALVKIGAPAVTPLIVALKAENRKIRQGAAGALEKIGAPAVTPLIVALNDEDKNIRQGAAQALGYMGGPQAVEPLISALKDVDGDVRQVTARALGNIGNARVTEPLIAALKDEDSLVRMHAGSALEKIGAPAVTPLIVALNDEDKNIRQGAALVLEEIGDPRAMDALEEHEIRELNLYRMLNDDLIQLLVKEGRNVADSSYSDSGYLYRDSHKRPCKNVLARAIGKALNNRGGKQAMQIAASVVLENLGPGAARELEVAWHGIGEWLG